MNADEYQVAAYVTVNPKLNYEQRMGNWIAGLAGEPGELTEAADSMWLGAREDISEEAMDVKLIKELGDCMWYGAALAQECGLKLSAVLGETSLKKFSHTAAGEEDEEHRELRTRIHLEPIGYIFVWSARASYRAGVLCDYLKKVLYHVEDGSSLRHELDKDKVSAGLRRYFAALAQVSAQIGGTNLELVGETNIAKLRARYMDGKFTAAQSVERKAGDV